MKATTNKMRIVIAAALFLIGGSVLLTGVSRAQDATPVTANPSFVILAKEDVDLNGKPKIWQTNRVTAYPDGMDSEEFRSEQGFIVANAAPLSVVIDGADAVELSLGEAVAVDDGDKVSVKTSNGTLASFYLVSLIEPLDVDSSDAKQEIGEPFQPSAGDYTMVLSAKRLDPGVAQSLTAEDWPGLLLVLNGDLNYPRPEGTSVIAAGEAGSQQGTFTLTAGENGAVFIVVTLEPAST